LVFSLNFCAVGVLSPDCLALGQVPQATFGGDFPECIAARDGFARRNGKFLC